MAGPTTLTNTPVDRASFKQYCLRRLGYPVIEINVDDDQIDDRINDSIRYYWDYHFDGSQKTYYKYQVTSNDLLTKGANGIDVPDNIMGIVNLFDVGAGVNTNNLFNIRYQIALNDLYTMTSQSMVPYYTAMQHMQTLEILLVGKQPLKYNRNQNKLYIDINWDKFAVGDYIIAEAYYVLDPDQYTKIWSDRWLQRYATQMIKQQWGTNLSKFSGMTLPGGIQFNGDKIYNDATQELAKLEDEMINSYSEPATMFIG